MPIYITLFNLTEQGVKNIKDAPKRIEEGIKAAESMGGKLNGKPDTRRSGIATLLFSPPGNYDAICSLPVFQSATAL